MLNNFTLNIHGIKVPPEAMRSMSLQFRLALTYIVLCAIISLIAEVVFNVILSLNHATDYNTVMLCIFSGCAVATLLIAFTLSLKFDMYVTGFPTLTAMLVGVFRCEALLRSGYNYGTVSAR